MTNCPHCGKPLDAEPRNFNICANCLIEFGYDAPEFSNAGEWFTDENLLHIKRDKDGNPLEPWWRKYLRQEEENQ